MSNSMNIFKQAYENLKTIIKERQQFEAAHPQEPYNLYKTDIDYTDIRRNSLLHYAAAAGDLDSIKECLQNGANINLKSKDSDSTAISVALAYGRDDAAKYLYEQNAKCLKLRADTCHLKCKPWFQDELKKALYEAFPNPRSNFTDAQVDNSFFRKTRFYDLKTFKTIKKTEGFIDALTRAAELGELDFIIAAKEKDENKVKAKLNSLLITASANGQMNVVKWTLANGAQINNDSKFNDSALQKAVCNDYPEIIDYLLENGADINKQNKRKLTPIMTAVIDNPVVIKKLLQNNPDLTLKDIDGNNVFHHLANMPYLDNSLQKLLLSHLQANTLIKQKNIYGFSPLDMAIQYQNDEFLKLMVPEELVKIKQSSVYGNPPVAINQSILRQKMYYYLKSHYRDVEYLNIGGLCNGFSYLYHFYATQGKKDYFFSTLALISSWDGKESSLIQPFKDIPQAKDYKNLADLFEQWINAVVWFQHSGFEKAKLSESLQSNRMFQHCMISGSKDLFPIYLFDTMDKQNLKKTISEYKYILNYLFNMPPKTHFELSGDRHITSAYKNDQGELSYYDPNFLYQINPVNTDELISSIIDYKYISSGVIEDDANEKDKVTPELRSFIFCKDSNYYEEALKNFEIFSNKELPKNKEEAEQFQANTTNRYTPLHIAVMTFSLASLQKLLAEDYYDINARDADGLSALDLALRNSFMPDIIIPFLTHPKVELNDPLVPHYLRGSKQFAQLLIDHKNSQGLYNLLYAALSKNDEALIEQLIIKKKVDINKTHPNFHSALMTAIKLDEENIVKLLLKYNADVLISLNPSSQQSDNLLTVDNCYITPLRAVIEKDTKYYPLIITGLKDINKFDENGYTAIHWAAANGRIDILNDLLIRGADPNLKTKNGKNVLDLLDEFRAQAKNDENTDAYKECLKVLLPVIKFDSLNLADQQRLSTLLFENVDKPDTDLFKLILQKCNTEMLNDLLIENPNDGKLKQIFLNMGLITIGDESYSQYVSRPIRCR